MSDRRFNWSSAELTYIAAISHTKVAEQSARVTLADRDWIDRREQLMWDSVISGLETMLHKYDLPNTNEGSPRG